MPLGYTFALHLLTSTNWEELRMRVTGGLWNLDLDVADRSIDEMALRSIMNLLCILLCDSMLTSLVKILSVSPTVADFAGTKEQLFC